MSDQHGKHTRRDAETMLLLGGFMCILALPVIGATPWAGHGFAQVVNALSGIALLLLGGAFIWRGRTLLQRSR
jgi:hypothetical protein